MDEMIERRGFAPARIPGPLPGFFLAIAEATGNLTAAVYPAAASALSQSPRWHSTVIEVYALNTVPISAFLFLVFGVLRNALGSPFLSMRFERGLPGPQYLFWRLARWSEARRETDRALPIRMEDTP